MKCMVFVIALDLLELKWQNVALKLVSVASIHIHTYCLFIVVTSHLIFYLQSLNSDIK